MNKQTLQAIRQLQIDEQLVVPWNELPKQRPQGEGWFGFKHYTFHSYPTEKGLVVKRIEKMPEEAEANKQNFIVQGNPHPDWK